MTNPADRLRIETDTLLGGWSLLRLTPTGWWQRLANHPTLDLARADCAKVADRMIREGRRIAEAERKLDDQAAESFSQMVSGKVYPLIRRA